MKKVSLLLIATVLFFSCEKEKVDIRDSAVGNYTYTATVQFKFSKLNIGMADSYSNETGVFVVEKSSISESELVIKLEDMIIKTMSVIGESNSFGFNIPQQFFTIDSPSDMSLYGMSNFYIGSQKYDGSFYNKEFNFGIQGKLRTNTDVGDVYVDYVCIYKGVKY